MSFDQPGTYAFHCKLHPFVKGTITVSGNPGDDTTEPDPVPQSNLDFTPPYIGSLSLAKSTFGSRGTTLRYGTDEKVTNLDAEIYRRDKKRLRFAGWRDWKNGHVGYNRVRFGNASKHFKPRHGSYVAFIRARDASDNESHRHRLVFAIR